jgi:excisionase family DNA binding protein
MEHVYDLEETLMNTQVTPASIRPLLVTVAEAARILAIGRSTAYELIASGQLESVTIGTARRIPVSALERFVESNTTRGYGEA